jgi:hypothetical protein
MQFDADHLYALAGYAEADPDIMDNHIRNGVPAIAEREYADTIDVLRMFKGDAEWEWLVDKLRANVRKLSRAVAVYRSNPAGQALRSNSLHSVVGRFYK